MNRRGGKVFPSHFVLFAFISFFIGFNLISCADEIEESKTYIVFSQGTSRVAETEKSVENLTEISLVGKSSAETLEKS